MSAFPYIDRGAAERARREQERIDAQTRSDTTPGLIQGLSDAYQLSVTGWSARAGYGAATIESDHNFVLTDKMLDEVAGDLPTDALEGLGYVRSYEDLVYQTQIARQQYERRRGLSQLGFTGSLLQLAAGFTDPVNLATFRLSSALSAAAGAGKYAQGLASAAGFVPLEALRLGVDPTAKVGDAAAGLASGFGVGFAGSLAANAGRLGSAAAQAAGAAGGQLAVDIPRNLWAAPEDRHWQETLTQAATNAALAAAFGALHARKAGNPESAADAERFVNDANRVAETAQETRFSPASEKPFTFNTKDEALSDVWRVIHDGTRRITPSERGLLVGRDIVTTAGPTPDFQTFWTTRNAEALDALARPVPADRYNYELRHFSKSPRPIESMPDWYFTEPPNNVFNRMEQAGHVVIHQGESFGARFGPDGELQVDNAFRWASPSQRQRMVAEATVFPRVLAELRSGHPLTPGTDLIGEIQRRTGFSHSDVSIALDEILGRIARERHGTSAAEGFAASTSRPVPSTETVRTAATGGTGTGSAATEVPPSRDMTLNEFRAAYLRGDITLGTETRTETTGITGKKTIEVTSESVGVTTAYDRLKASGELPKVPVTASGAPPVNILPASTAPSSEPRGAMGAATRASIQGGALPHPNADKPGVLDLSAVTDSHLDSVFGLPPSVERMGNIGSMIDQSDVPVVRLVGNALAPDPLMKADGTPAIETGSAWGRRMHETDTGIFEVQGDALYAAHKAQQRRNGLKPSSREEFMTAVTDWNEANPGSLPTDPALREAVKFQREQFARMGTDVKLQGTKGSDGFDIRDGYVPHVGDRFKIDLLIREIEGIIGDSKRAVEAVVDGFQRAIVNRGPGKLNPRMRRAYALAIKEKWGGVGNYADQTNPYSPFDPHQLTRSNKEVLVKFAKQLGMSDADIERALYVSTIGDESGKPTFLRQRIEIDPFLEVPIVNPDTGKVIKTIKMRDLMERDGERLLIEYSRRARGAQVITEIGRVLEASEAKQFIDFAKKPIETIDDVLDTLHTVAAKGGQANSAFDADMARIEFLLRHAAMIPTNEAKSILGHDMQQVGRIIRQTATARYLSNVPNGVQNLGELGYGVTQTGVRAMLKTIPDLPAMIRSVKAGDRGKAVELFQMGVAAETDARLRPFQQSRDGWRGATLDRADHLSARAARLSSRMSLMRYTQAFIERWVSNMAIQRMYDIALSKKTPGKVRLGQMGMTEADWQKVAAELRTKVQVGKIGQWLTLDLPSWDGEAARLMRQAVSLVRARNAVRNDAAQQAKWMSSTAGKIGMQFQTYAYQSWTAKTLSAVQEGKGDMTARPFFAILASMLGGVSLYAVSTYIRSIGRPDADQYRADMLSQDRLIKASISRADVFGIWPSLIDTGAPLVREGPVFAFARASQGSRQTPRGGFFTGTPMANLVEDLAGLPRFGWRLLRDGHRDDFGMTQRDANDLRSGFLIPDYLNLHNAFRQLAYPLPKNPPTR